MKSSMIRLMVSLAAVAVVSNSYDRSIVCGQEPSRWEATSPPTLDFSGLVIGKVGTENGDAVVMLIKPKWQAETKTRSYAVTKYVPETRTRIVDVPNQGQVEQTYTVKVPVTEERTAEYTALEPVGKDKVTIPLASTRAWDIRGKVLSPEELTTLLAKPTHLMLLPSATPPVISPYFASVLSPNLIFLYNSEAGANMAAPGGFEAPMAAPAAPGIDVPPAPIVDPNA